MNGPVTATSAAGARHRRHWVHAAALKFSRTLHIYLSLLGLCMMVFFATTGFMLNHEAWFDRVHPATHMRQGQLPPAMFHPIDKLAIAEKLRSDFYITGVVVEFTADPDEVRVIYKGPGRRTDAAIDPATGHVELTFESRGLIGRITDLHRGADSGAAWRRVIDAAAILIAAGALTGVFMWWHLPRRRRLGLVAILLGLGLSAAVYFAMVP